MKTFANYRYFTGSRMRIPPTPQREWRQLKGIVSLNSTFENADSQSFHLLWRQLKGILSLNSTFENADSQSSTCYEK
jgi:hypothetical protein